MDASKLARMANDIAKNFAALGEDEAISLTANHIRMFWDPRMRRQAFAMINSGGGEFSEIARSAIEKLAGASAENG